MLENIKTISNEGISNEQVINNIVHLASTKEISFKLTNENIKDSTVINNVTISLSKSFEFQDLVERQKELEDSFLYIPEENAAKRLEISS